jgi:hypothetical protein
LGLFSKEAYDFDNPTAQLTLDEKRFNKARREFEDLGTDIWCTIDRLTLVKINSSYTECAEQITKADRNACHALCEKANPAPRYGGLVPPLYLNKSLKPTVTRVTPFAEMANPAPRYGGLVPPFYEQ